MSRLFGVRALFVVCLVARVAGAQVVHDPSALTPVAADFCKTCRRVATLETASVYEDDQPDSGGVMYWLVMQTTTGKVAGPVFEQIAGSCGAGHCEYVDRVVPALRVFSYRVGANRVTDIGLELEIDGTHDVLETDPRTSTPWTRWWFVACTKTATGPWPCRTAEPTCDHPSWGRTAAPTIQSTCSQSLGSDS